MQSFNLVQPRGIEAAVSAAAMPHSKYIAGGSDLMQLMKDNVETPEHLVDLEQLPLGGVTVGRSGLRLAAMARLSTEMLYACPNVAVTRRLVAINAGLPTYMRAPGESSGNFALESAIDELAVSLKRDPLQFRIQNYTEQDPHENKPFASKMLRACYQQGAVLFGWSRRMPEPRSMRNGRMLMGWGVATSTYPTNQRPA